MIITPDLGCLLCFLPIFSSSIQYDVDYRFGFDECTIELNWFIYCCIIFLKLVCPDLRVLLQRVLFIYLFIYFAREKQIDVQVLVGKILQRVIVIRYLYMARNQKLDKTHNMCAPESWSKYTTLQQN